MPDHTIGLDGSNGVDQATTGKTVTTKTRGTTTNDVKLVACIRIGKMIEALNPVERAFVLDYVNDRFTTRGI
jgi:hypothetical protein